MRRIVTWQGSAKLAHRMRPGGQNFDTTLGRQHGRHRRCIKGIMSATASQGVSRVWQSGGAASSRCKPCCGLGKRRSLGGVHVKILPHRCQVSNNCTETSQYKAQSVSRRETSVIYSSMEYRNDICKRGDVPARKRLSMKRGVRVNRRRACRTGTNKP